MEMDFNMAFAILKIEMTMDESLIRSAYRMALPANNPEDNPEGFKTLRAAYEKALTYIHILDHIPEPEDNTPIGILQKKLTDLYQSLSKRINCELWKELLQDDVFYDLDTYEEAKWELFAFLQENYRIPREIVLLLDEHFDICKNAREFKEKLPVAFVDYMVSVITNKNSGFSYEWFGMLEGKDDADYDTFLSYVQELEIAIRNEDKTRAGNLIQILDAMEIRYPCYSLDKADYFIETGKYEEARAIVLELADIEKYKNNVYVQMHCGEALWNVGEIEKAYAALCQSLVLDEENYIGNKYAALYAMEQGEQKKALYHIYANGNLRNDEKINEAANRLEKEFIALCGQNTESLEAADARLLAYAYSYQGEPDKAIEVMLSRDSYEKEIKGYHSILSSLYKQKKEYLLAEKYAKLSLKYVQEKLAKLEKGEPVEECDTKESLTRSLSGSNLQIGLVLMLRAKGMRIRKERVKLCQEAIPFLKAACDLAHENIIAQMDLAYCYLETRDFQETYAIYDELIHRLGEQSGLLFLKQQLCYVMGNTQAVVALYYQMLGQGARDAGIYEYAARAFIDEQQFEDAKTIFAKAEKDGVTSYGLRALNLICRFLSSKTYNGFALELNEELDDMLCEGEQDLENENTKDYLAELYYIKALSAAQFQKNKKKHLLSAIEVHDREKYHNALAELYIQLGQHQEALKEYSYIEENFTPDAKLYIKMATRYFIIHDIRGAREYVQKVIDLAPENENSYRAAAVVYDDFASAVGIFYHDSVRLWKRYIAYNPEDIAFAYMRCTIAHLNLGQYQEALFCLTEWKENAQWDDCEYEYDTRVFLGKTYNGLGRYEEAASCIEQGFETLKEKEKSDGYALQAMRELGHIYMKLGKIDAADQTMRGYMEYHAHDQQTYASIIITLMEMYVSAGLYEKVETLLKFYTYAEKLISEGLYTYLMLSARYRVCTSYREKKRLFWKVKKALRAYGRNDLRKLYADMLAYDFLMVKAAISVREKMLRMFSVMTWEKNKDDLFDLIRMNKFLGREDDVARYKKVILDAMQRHFGCGDLDIYAICIDNAPAWRLKNITFLVQLFSLTGEVALAEKYIAMMEKCALCTNCNETICYDRFEAFGVFYEAKGDIERAYDYYEKAVKSHGYYKGYAMLCMKRKYGNSSFRDFAPRCKAREKT